MNNSRLIVAACLIATCSILAFAGPQGQTAPMNVLVTNTSSQPVPVSLYHTINVPVTGNVGVNNTSSNPVPVSLYHTVNLPVVQGGTWNVVKNGDLVPYYNTGFISSGSGLEVSEGFSMLSNQRLIIDQVSLYSKAGSPSDCFTLCTLMSSGAHASHGSIWAELASGPYPNTSFANVQTAIDVEPGDNVQFTFDRATANSTGGAYWSVSGHYVP